jgi:hypothetical protein
MFNSLEQQFRGGPPELARRSINGRQSGKALSRFRNIVKSDNAEFFSRPDPGTVQGFDGPERNDIVVADCRAWRVSQLKKVLNTV